MNFHPSVGSLILVNITVVTLVSLELKLDRAWSQTVDRLPVIQNLEYIDPKLSSSFFLTSNSYFIPLDVLPNNGLDAFRSSYTLLDFYSPKQELSILNFESNPLSEFPKFPETNWQDRIFRFPM